MDINLESKYLEELGKGDHKAFDMLYIQYSPRLKHFLTGFIKNRDEASDMTQALAELRKIAYSTLLLFF